MSRATAKTGPIQLRYDDKQGIVIVTPADEDRFAVTVEAAINACQAVHELAMFQKQFKRLLARLAEWTNAKRSEIDDAFLTVRDEGLLFLVVQKKRTHDRAIEDSLTKLDIRVAQDPQFELIRLSVLGIPASSEDSIQSFLVPENTMHYAHA